MASSADDTLQRNEIKIDCHLVRYMQTALAIAIIKRTPAGQSAQEYAEQLCVQYRQSQLKWKDRVDTLKQEVLLLKQQLLEQRWKEEGLIPKEQDKDPDTDDSQVYPTPPFSSEDPLNDTRAVAHTQEQLLARHASFLQSVLTLSTISTHSTKSDYGVPAGTSAIDPAFEQTASESIQSSLITLGDLITSASPRPMCVSKKMILHMVQVITNLVDSMRFSKFLADAICDMVLCFAWGIISTMLINKELCEEAADRLSTLVQLLSRSPKLRPPLVQMLVTQLIQVAQHLRSVHQHQAVLDLRLFQNCYHIFRSLEAILEQDILRQDKCLSVAFCQGVHRQLDDCLLHIWESFQPFAQYTWHIEGLLQYVHPQTLVGDTPRYP